MSNKVAENTIIAPLQQDKAAFFNFNQTGLKNFKLLYLLKFFILLDIKFKNLKLYLMVMSEKTRFTQNKKNGCDLCLGDDPSIMKEIAIINHFQPITSVTKGSLVAYESLLRGECRYCGRTIPPFEIFKKLKGEDELFDVELKSRKNAIEFFNKALTRNKELLLFLNFDANLIESGMDSGKSLYELCNNQNISPHNVVIEITESKPCKLELLIKFMENCRNYGFLIALDDVGAGYSNFDRICAIQPDIIKLDRTIIDGLDKNYHKKVIFRSMSRLASKMGILLLAEGVEEEGEVLYSVELGADLLQGFYIAKPQAVDPHNQPDLMSKINSIEVNYRNYKINSIKKTREKHQVYDDAVKAITDKLINLSIDRFDEVLAEYSNKFEFIESLYTIDSEGTQVTDSHINYRTCQVKPRIYKIFKKGDSHYNKEYFYLVQESILDKFTTDTYFSHMTGNLCKTKSIRFLSKDNREYLLCMNIKEC